MSVRTRLGRLEGRMAGLSICALCRGKGKDAVRVAWDPEIPLAGGPRPDPGPDPRPEPEWCPRCGKVNLTVVRVVYENRLPGGGVHERRS
jgi:hypothetical protein